MKIGFGDEGVGHDRIVEFSECTEKGNFIKIKQPLKT
jgi:hypothetical protein